MKKRALKNDDQPAQFFHVIETRPKILSHTFGLGTKVIASFQLLDTDHLIIQLIQQDIHMRHLPQVQLEGLPVRLPKSLPSCLRNRQLKTAGFAKPVTLDFGIMPWPKVDNISSHPNQRIKTQRTM